MMRQEKNTGVVLTKIIYTLQALSFIFGFTLIVAAIINYIKLESVQGTWLASHFRWQIRTFWFSVLWGFIGGILVYVGIGFMILGLNVVWLIYRIIKGWLNLAEARPMY